MAASSASNGLEFCVAASSPSPPSTGAQHIPGDGEFMGRRADVVARVVQDQVLEMARSIHSDAQASAKCDRSIHPVPTFDGAMHMSRRTRAMPDGGKDFSTDRTYFHEHLTI